jgi:hypothetical protein
MMVAHDKGKPAARRGRKAVSLYKLGRFSSRLDSRDCLVAEGDPKIAVTSVGHLVLLPLFEYFAQAAEAV